MSERRDYPVPENVLLRKEPRDGATGRWPVSTYRVWKCKRFGELAGNYSNRVICAFLSFQLLLLPKLKGDNSTSSHLHHGIVKRRSIQRCQNHRNFNVGGTVRGEYDPYWRKDGTRVVASGSVSHGATRIGGKTYKGRPQGQVGIGVEIPIGKGR
ncbi:uncharacterized protein LOC142775153 [Rhipicephalus microplus]|uniref:uncharacterized protein LOC142775153 n=1 Tax=Rhipicephalus microplus TaxID=6941 RepID=UPI003F6AE3F2